MPLRYLECDRSNLGLGVNLRSVRLKFEIRPTSKSRGPARSDGLLRFNVCSPDTLTLCSNTPEMGEAMEHIPTEYEGDEMTMGFNARYLLEVLSVLPESKIALELTDPLSPGILRASDSDEFFYVIMPMRV